ncbi:MAG: AlpA family phage regulatory protein [Rhodospirillaceae bacterium]|jgi:predicted DNA-binding transcriptional regulator AlpA|nr:AlpA family phage regulatory protein [Rhodospirillaceae bacterium]MBT5938284.1 AlpA family phage regulatory protein [Rhodospirillaceae bacterium]MBT7267926.1 AlpA family phage regulatory protein [Rhodospirillaceae bacterium]
MRVQFFQRRGLNRKEAANYIGCSASKFDEMVVDGRMPQPKQIDRRLVWDRHELDTYFDELPRRGVSEINEWDEALCQ